MKYLFSILCFLTSLSIHAQQVIYVDSIAAGVNDGSSWADAFPLLQDAFVAAGVGDTIKIAKGTYFPDEGGGQISGDRDAHFQLKDSTKVFGGYSSGGSSIASPVQNQTILSGEINQDTIESNNSSCLFFFLGKHDCSLNGLTMSKTYSLPPSGGSFSSIYLFNSSLLINECKFSNHKMNTSSIILQFSNLEINNSNFYSNYFLDRGLLALNYSDCQIIDSKFYENIGDDGTLFYSDYSDLSINNCELKNNHSNEKLIYSTYGTLEMVGCVLQENTGTNNYNILGYKTDMFFDRMLFKENSSTKAGAALHLGQDVNCSIYNSIFLNNNSDDDGESIANRSADAINIINCTFLNHSQGNAVDTRSSAPVLFLNCVFWGNYYDLSSNNYVPTVRNSIISKWDYGSYNLAIDPQYENADSFNFNVPNCSPTLNSGEYRQDLPSLDFFGQPRIVGSAVDIGAVEHPSLQQSLYDIEIEVIDNPTCSSYGFAVAHFYGDSINTFVSSTLDQSFPLDSLTPGEHYIRIISDSCIAEDTFYVDLTPLTSTLYVDSTANGNNTGCTWQNAFTKFQDALRVATAGDTILMAKGTYFPDEGIDQVDNDSTFYFNIGSDMFILGGYPSGGGLVSNSILYPTTLSGEIQQDTTIENNSKRILRSYGNNVTLVNLNITKGYSLNHVAKSPVELLGNGNYVANCEFYDNVGSDGGGMYIYRGEIENCNFYRNKANNGGAFYEGFFTSSKGIKCYDNNANRGGAIVLASSAQFDRSIKEAHIFNNHASDRGGAIYGNTVVVENSLIYNNTAAGSGGAIYATFAKCTNTTIVDNTSAALGGAISGVTSAIRNCIVWFNSIPEISVSQTSYIYESVLNANGGISEAPLFTNRAVNDYSLKPCSPAINRGNNDYFSDSFDILKNDRIVDSIIDIGAIEYQAMSPKEQSRHYIDPSAIGLNDGGSWANAFNSWNEAFECSYVDDTIFVAEGTYLPDAFDRTKSFVIKEGIDVIGSFPSGGGVQDIINHPSVLSGDIGVLGEQTDNSYSVVRMEGTGARSLNGFKIIHGQADSIHSGYDKYNSGGGIYTFGGGSNAYHIYNCTFTDNFAQYGGAASIQSTYHTRPRFYQCLIYDNEAAINGGAFFVDGTGANSTVQPRMYQSTIANNDHQNSTLYTISNKSRPIIRNSIIWGKSILENSAYLDVQNSLVKSLGHDYPNFIDTLSNDFRLGLCSPAVNGGNNANVISGNVVDIEGNPRKFDNYKVDIGAFEEQGNFAHADIFTISLDNPLTCHSLAVATVEVRGQAPFSYSWSNGDTTATATGLIAGTHTVTISSDDCIDEGSIKIRINDPGAIIYVDSTSTAIDPSGCTWSTAFQKLQDAIDVAAAGDSILIAKGTYYPDEGQTVSNNNVNARFNLLNGMSLIGGFPSGGGDFSDINHRNNKVRLSGEIQQDNNNGNNTAQIVNAFYGVDTIRLVGLTIEYGYDLTPYFRRGVAGLYSDNSNLVLSNCQFLNNHSFRGTAGAYYYSSHKYINCVFSGNSSYDCTGIYGGGGSKVELYGCSFGGNLSNPQRWPSTLYMENATFKSFNCIYWNRNHYEGFYDFPQVEFTDCLVRQFIPGEERDDFEPIFRDEENGILELAACSPIVNLGNNSHLHTNGLDANSNPRLFASVVDWGAFEYQDTFNIVRIDSAVVYQSTSCFPTGSAEVFPSVIDDISVTWSNGGTTFYVDSLHGGHHRAFVTSGTCFDSVDIFIPIVDSSNVIYVDSAADFGINDGCTWPGAFRFLQNALASADLGDTIKIAAGSYSPLDGYYVEENGQTAFGIDQAQIVLGGFNSTINLRDPENYQSILSGTVGDKKTNTILLIKNAGINVHIDGLDIANLNGNASVASALTIISNSAQDSCAPKISDCRIYNNNGERGAGIRVEAKNGGQVNLQLSNCKVFDNGAWYYGGALAIINDAVSETHTQIRQCLFYNNDNFMSSNSEIYLNNQFSQLDVIQSTIVKGENSIQLMKSDGPSQINVINSNFQGFIQISSSGILNATNSFVDRPNDPITLFNDVSQSDYSLFPGSIGINDGDSTAVIGLFTSDLAGNPRVVDQIDIGAYENQIECKDGTLHVRQFSNGDGSGSDWANALTSLHEAVILIGQCSGDTVKVSGGFYKDDWADQRQGIKITDNAVILGGYNPQTNSRDVNQYFSFLDGNVGDLADPNDNAYHVFHVPSYVTNAVVDGFIIRKGNANGTDMKDQLGGGIYCEGEVQLRNIKFYDLKSLQGGAAIYVAAPYGKLELIDSEIDGSSVDFKGSILIEEGGRFDMINSGSQN